MSVGSILALFKKILIGKNRRRIKKIIGFEQPNKKLDI